MILVVLFHSPKCHDSTSNMYVFLSIRSLNSQTFPHQIDTKYFNKLPHFYKGLYFHFLNPGERVVRTIGDHRNKKRDFTLEDGAE